VRLIEPLHWDSAFFDLSIGRVCDGIDAATIGVAVREADRQQIDCLYLLAAVDDDRLLECAQRQGFIVRDIRMELEQPVLGDADIKHGLRHATPSDLARLAPIARERVRGTRFFADPGFLSTACQELYVAWLRRGVAKIPGRITLMPADASGFVVCHLDRKTATGAIELIAVAAGAEGRGIGSALVAGAGRLFAEASLERATVVTQGRNLAGQRLYQRHGYRTSSVHLWLHRWLPKDLAAIKGRVDPPRRVSQCL
jgi:ribosomal protein S18 acetylase RimI-like enzyme